ncbi:MAG: radical SAM protein [Dehalococcoidia bacterium]|nr:MAG: radical SAM protein [Dehalococcoidia bacterium]
MAVYRQLYEAGELRERAEQAGVLLEDCHVCPRDCRVNRLEEETGKCRTGRQALVSSAGPHFGEEAPLVGMGGSGTIFFTNCNLQCCFCQNYSISQLGEGHGVVPDELAGIMLSLQRKGCHNINFVSPTHVVPQILEALEIAAGAGLSLPLVYNSGGYDSVETLKLLDGVIDIYMPDMKYSDEGTARRLSGIEDYPNQNRAAVKEMHRQVGDLELDEHGVALRGLLVRHLVLPQGLAGTPEVCSFLYREISANTYINVMAQYRPCYHAFEVSEISHSLSSDEFAEAVTIAHNAGLHRLDRVEDRSSARIFRIL